MDEGQRRTVPVESVRLLVWDDRTYRKLGRLAWSKRDASLYVIPYGLDRPKPHYVGVDTHPEGVDRTTINYSEGEPGLRPKLSLHESGRCHARLDSPAGKRTRPVEGPRLDAVEGDKHVATLLTFDYASLPAFVGEPRSAPNVDLVLFDGAEIGAPGVRVPIFVTRDEGAASDHKAWITFRRETLDGPLHIGLGAVALTPDGDGDPGVLACAGWGVAHDGGDIPLVYAVT